jgi:amino acid transporter
MKLRSLSVKYVLHALSRPPEVKSLGRVSPLAGLARRQLPARDVLAQSVAAMAPTAAVATMPAMVAATAGSGSSLAILLAAAVVLMVGYAVGQFAKRFAAAGSLYSYVAQAFGPITALFAGVSLLLGYAGIAMTAVVGTSLHAGNFVRAVDLRPTAFAGSAVILLVVAAVCCSLLFRGIRVSSRGVLLVEGLAIMLLLVLVAAAFWQAPPQAWLPSPSITSLDSLATGTMFALVAFVGFESGSVLAVESKRPLRTVPRVLTISSVAGAVLYATASQAQFAAVGGDAAVLAAAGGSFRSIAAATNATWLLPWLELGAALSFLACALACTTAVARVLLTMGREGVLPVWLGRTHPVFLTPFNGLAVSVPAIVALPVTAMAMGVDDWALLNAIAATAIPGYVMAYILTCVAMPVFLKRIGELTAVPLLISLASSTVLAALLAMYVVHVVADGSGWGLAAYVAVLVLSLSWFRVRRRRGHLTGIGLYDVPTQSDILGGDAAGWTAPAADARS